MTLSIIIGLATMLIALNGLIFQPKKDPEGPTNWKNINTFGRILFGLIILLIVLNIAESYYDERNHTKEVNRLLTSQEELKEINGHLIKVMSVADGYNAIIRGIVAFDNPVDDNKIRTALNNVFLKYAQIDLRAINKLGEYKGRIDYATHPEVRKYLRLSEIPERSFFSRYREIDLINSYFFEIRCSKLKILNDDKIQYARFDKFDEVLDARARSFEWSRDFGRLYHVNAIYIDELEIEELDKVKLGQWLYFGRL